MTGANLQKKPLRYPMAASDLAGVTRLVGSRIDIGCYEAQPFGTILIVK